MTSGYLVSYIFLWVLVVFLILLVLLLYRQFGLTYLGAHKYVSLQGLDLGARAREFEAVSLDGNTRRYSWPQRTPGSLRALIFAASTCTVCGHLAETAASTPRDWPDAEFYWVEQGRGRRAARPVDTAAGWTIGLTPGGDHGPHRTWAVSHTPFMFVIDWEGIIRAKGIVNSSDDISRLLDKVKSRHIESRQLKEAQA